MIRPPPSSPLFPYPPLSRSAPRAPLGPVPPPVKAQQGYYVLKVLERVPPSPGALAGERDTLTKEGLAQKQGQAWESWINAARANAKGEGHYKPTARRGGGKGEAQSVPPAPATPGGARKRP